MLRHLIDERLAGGHAGAGVDRQVDLAFAQAVDLQSDEPARCVLYTASLTRSSTGWPLTHVWMRGPRATMRSLFQPSSTKKLMSFVDLLLRRQPVRAHRFAIQQAGRRLPLVEPPDFDLRSVDAPGGGLEPPARALHGPDLCPDLNAGIGDRIDRRLELELEIVELLQRAQEGVHARAALHGPADDGAVLDGEAVRAVHVDPAVQRRPVEQVDPPAVGWRLPVLADGAGAPCCGSAKAMMESPDFVAFLPLPPAAITTYCRPSTM